MPKKLGRVQEKHQHLPIKEQFDWGVNMVDSEKMLSVRIFEHASAVTINRLTMSCTRRCYSAGQTIVNCGEDATDVMVLLTGEVRVTVYSESGKEVAFRDIGSGEVFGDYSAIDSRPRSADVTALSDVEVGMIKARDFVNLVTSDPAVCHAHLHELISMIRLLGDRVYELSTQKAAQRLRNQLVRMAQIEADGSGLIDVLPTHSDLAALIGAQRHVVTTELNELEAAQLISRADGSLIIPKLNALLNAS